MAALNVNTTLKRFLNGGILTLVSGSDTLTIKNIEDGEMTFTPPTREVIEYKDTGVQQQALEGDDVYGEVSITLNAGQLAGSNSLYAELFTAGSGGLVNEFASLTIDIPTSRGAATGERTVLSLLHTKMDPPPQFKKGSRLDELSFTMRCRTWTAPVAY